MMQIFALLVIPAGVALVAWHLVRPNFFDLRVSMAAFLPDLPHSTAARNRISLVPPVTSLPFLLRMIFLATIIAMLWSHLAPPPPTIRQTAPPHLRIVLDLSPSMALAERLHQAADVVTELLGKMKEAHPAACTDLALVAETLSVVPAAHITAALAAAETATHGQPATVLLTALGQPGSCGSNPTHAALVSDQPPAAQARQFGGPLIWWQVGAPLQNRALEGIRMSGGGISGQTPKIIARARDFGAGPDAPVLALKSPADSQKIRMTRDISRQGGWQAVLPYAGAGVYEISLTQGGAYGDDDRMTADLPDLRGYAVDWQLSGLLAPVALAGGGPGDPLVAPLAQVVPPSDRPALLVYDDWDSAGSSRIGVFRQQHPFLHGVNFDVLESNLPLGLSVLPEGFEPVLMSDTEGGRAIVALRANPRAAIVPAPTGADPDRRALSLLIFSNALRFITGADEVRPVDARHISGQGKVIEGAFFESETSRALLPPPDLAVLKDNPSAAAAARSSASEPPDTSWVPWLVVLAAIALIGERVSGLKWSRRT